MKEKLQRKIDHLFRERKSKERKMRNLRKEVLEVLTNEIILTAKASGIDTVVIEDLSFKEVPEWKDKTLRWLFSTWFYARFSERLKEKAKREGIRVREENPANTSKRCFCGREVKKEGHYLICSVHGKYDRDYTASINLGKRYLKPPALEVGGIPETVPSGGASSSILSPSTLTAYFRLVYCYFLVSLYSQQVRTRILNGVVKRC
ncbi:MAG: transposase [Aquificota bacterium]|nr:transposase [Aquificota bacterium]